LAASSAPLFISEDCVEGKGDTYAFSALLKGILKGKRPGGKDGKGSKGGDAAKKANDFWLSFWSFTTLLAVAAAYCINAL
jgi:hypothetical protein